MRDLREREFFTTGTAIILKLGGTTSSKKLHDRVREDVAGRATRALVTWVSHPEEGPKPRRTDEFRCLRQRPGAIIRVPASAPDRLRDLTPDPDVSAFLRARPHLIAFLDAARARIRELAPGAVRMSLRISHERDGVILVARIDGTAEEASRLMDRFDEEWLLKLPRGADEGATVDIRGTR